MMMKTSLLFDKPSIFLLKDPVNTGPFLCRGDIHFPYMKMSVILLSGMQILPIGGKEERVPIFSHIFYTKHLSHFKFSIYGKERSHNMDLKFRKLRADEIEARVSQVNKGGVQILLYKDARCDQNLLDETVGPMNWQKSYSRDNANCVVSIWDPDKKQWISKEDTGSESNVEKEKGLASDSFKRACFNWGLGRELYTSPKIFFKKEDLKGYKSAADANSRPTDFGDEFIVTDIEYDDVTGVIKTVTIQVSYYGTGYLQKTFGSLRYLRVQKALEKAEAQKTADETTVDAPDNDADGIKLGGDDNAETSSKKKAEPSEKEDGIVDLDKPAPAPKKKGKTIKLPFPGETEILIGNLKGERLDDVKNTSKFRAFLRWAAEADKEYETDAENVQFKAFKELGILVYGKKSA